MDLPLGLSAIKEFFRFLSGSAILRFRSDWDIFKLLNDRILFMIISHTVFFASPVIGSSKVSSVIDCSLGLSVLFFRYAGAFLSKGASPFFLIKNRCSVLRYIFKKTFTLFFNVHN